MNQKRALKTLAMDKQGVSWMWKAAPEEMIAAGVKPMGSYDPHNGQGGKIWGWKHEAQGLTNDRVKRIMFACIQSGKLTIWQLDGVRKAFSYAFQLLTGTKGDPGQKCLNFQCMRRVWKTIDRSKLPASSQTSKPTKIPTLKEVKVAFRKPWSKDHPWSFLKFTTGVRYAYDCFIFGLRAKEDVSRVKKSRSHFLRPAAGWMSTEFLGGRCKCEIARPWKLYTVCFCPGGVHISPEEGDHKQLDKEGNPKVDFKWHSTCPLATFEFQQQFEDAIGRRYAKLNQAGNAFTVVNEADPPAVAIDWFVTQGVCDPQARFSHNSGRKCLANLLSKCVIPYPQGFEIHADRHSVWQRDYQPDCLSVAGFDRRTQHTNPTVCCIALQKIANKFGLGLFKMQPLNRQEKLTHRLLVKMDDKEEADRIILGQDGDSEDEEDLLYAPPTRPAWLPKKVPPPPRKKRRRRVPELDEEWYE